MGSNRVRRDWINTSVDDLRSTLDCTVELGLVSRLPELRATAAEAERLGHRTRAKLLRSTIRRIELSAEFKARNGAQRP